MSPSDLNNREERHIGVHSAIGPVLTMGGPGLCSDSYLEMGACICAALSAFRQTGH
jgi:hypothetical protein